MAPKDNIHKKKMCIRDRPIIDPETGCPNFFSLKANYKIVEQMIEAVSYTHLFFRHA